jgi:hypothetical protein
MSIADTCGSAASSRRDRISAARVAWTFGRLSKVALVARGPARLERPVRGLGSPAAQRGLGRPSGARMQPACTPRGLSSRHPAAIGELLERTRQCGSGHLRPVPDSIMDVTIFMLVVASIALVGVFGALVSMLLTKFKGQVLAVTIVLLLLASGATYEVAREQGNSRDFGGVGAPAGPSSAAPAASTSATTTPKTSPKPPSSATPNPPTSAPATTPGPRSSPTRPSRAASHTPTAVAATTQCEAWAGSKPSPQAFQNAGQPIQINFDVACAKPGVSVTYEIGSGTFSDYTLCIFDRGTVVIASDGTAHLTTTFVPGRAYDCATSHGTDSTRFLQDTQYVVFDLVAAQPFNNSSGLMTTADYTTAASAADPATWAR